MNPKSYPGASKSVARQPSAVAAALGRSGAIATVALLAAGAGAAIPTITQHPMGRVVNPGAAVTLSVTAVGDQPLAYQWLKLGLPGQEVDSIHNLVAGALLDWPKLGTPISGATGSQLSFESIQLRDSGRYSVVVSNPSGRVISKPAAVSVIPNELRATHGFPLNAILVPVAALNATTAGVSPLRLRKGYIPGSLLRIDCQLTYPAPITALTWQVTLPAGWSYAAARVLTPGAGEVRTAQPAAGATGALEWRWSAVPANPYGFRFVYEVMVPAGTSGPQTIAATAGVTMTGHAASTIAVVPNPLVIPMAGDGRRWHSVDTNQDGRISLAELTRLLQLFNTRVGKVRTGGYQSIDGTEDGFDADFETDVRMARLNGDYHTADTNLDGRLSLLEITRVIELYNSRDATGRTGAYRSTASSEDGFSPGP